MTDHITGGSLAVQQYYRGMSCRHHFSVEMPPRCYSFALFHLASS